MHKIKCLYLVTVKLLFCSFVVSIVHVQLQSMLLQYLSTENNNNKSDERNKQRHRRKLKLRADTARKSNETKHAQNAHVNKQKY